MIPHQSAMIVWIFIKISPLIFILEVRIKNRKSVVQVVNWQFYDYADVMSKFVYRKQKCIEFAKCCQKKIKY